MKLTSAEVIARITLAASRLGITLSASTSPIKMGVELGNFLIEKFVNNTVEALDGVGGVDQLLVDFFKSLSDNPEVAEAIALDYYKYLTHEAEMSDDEIIDFFKNLANTASVGELYEPHFFKNTGNQFIATDDDASLETGKNRFNTAEFSDDDVIEFGLNKSDPTLLAEAHYADFYKNTDNEFSVAEQIDRRDFYKSIYNTVNFTDDVDGAASILDDQEMAFFKNTTDISGVAESFDRQVNYDRKFTHTAGAADDSVNETGKNVANTSNVADDDTIFVGKGLADQPVAREQHAFSVGKPTSDAYTVSDLYSMEFGRGFGDAYEMSDVSVNAVYKNISDSVEVAEDSTVDFGNGLGNTSSIQELAARHFYKSLSYEPYVPVPEQYFAGDYVLVDNGPAVASDSISIGPGKTLGDQAAAGDSFYRLVSFNRSFNDGVGFTDDVDGAASILDDQEMQFYKFNSDTTRFAEQIQRAISRSITDAASLIEAAEITFNKTEADAAAIQDAATASTGKSVADSSAISDALARAFGNQLTDASAAGDSIANEPGKRLSNTTSFADAGSLRSQGFSDFTYFAEDFVGASRTF
jgi:hypothetical protein